MEDTDLSFEYSDVKADIRDLDLLSSKIPNPAPSPQTAWEKSSTTIRSWNARERWLVPLKRLTKSQPSYRPAATRSFRQLPASVQ